MDRYQKMKKIGEGAFGRAYLVKSKKDQQQFVIKEINIARMSRKERDEARKEVSVLSTMNHPNIVKYRESFEEVGNLYICMDYCDAGDLYSKINAQRGILILEDQVLDWFVQICLSLKHIHDRKILHRDIKSQNIFLTRQGTVKLGDFGIAKVLNSTVELARTCIGTPYYLSPEIVENRPYNNKSDIWSLGCVLYELTTLKHAFEAQNMKNLVLKIIRGTYPPVSSKYSFDIRKLISLLFKRNPRDRPSINNILKMPIIERRIPKFLTEDVMAREFSHTVMHGMDPLKPSPRPLPQPRPAVRGAPANRGRPLPQPARPGSAQGRPGSAQPRPNSALRKSNEKEPNKPVKYDPASVYAPSSARRSRDANNRKSAEVERRRVAAAAAAAQQDIMKKRQELLDREQKRRELKKQQDDQFARQHKDLMDKQKQARLKKAREEGWKNVLESSSSSSSSDKKEVENLPDYIPSAPKPAQKPDFRVPDRIPDKDRGSYEKYHQFLDEMAQRRQQQPGNGGNYMVAPTPGPAAAAAKAHQDRVLGQQAAEKARVVEEFWSRKREAARNKDRVVQDPPAQRPLARSGEKRPLGAEGRNDQEREYLERLKQIRQQNFQERRNVQQVQGNRAHGVKAALQGDDPEIRRKKLEALKAQAADRAEKLKQQLDKRRQDQYQRAQAKPESRAVNDSRPSSRPAENRAVPGGRAVPNQKPSENRAVPDQKPSENRAVPDQKPSDNRAAGNVRAVPAARAVPEARALPGGRAVPGDRAAPGNVRAVPQPKPRPAPPMTEVLNQLGRIEEPVKQTEETPAEIKSPVQQQKESILKRLNQKQRPKWGAGDVGPLDLANMELEETASNMEVTSARDSPSAPPEGALGAAEGAQEAPPSARRQWRQTGSVLEKLGNAPIIDGNTRTLETPPAVASSEPSVGRKNWGVGKEDVVKSLGNAPVLDSSTITIDKEQGSSSSVCSKTVTVSQSEPSLKESQKTLVSPPKKSASEGSVPIRPGTFDLPAKTDVPAKPEATELETESSLTEKSGEIPKWLLPSTESIKSHNRSRSCESASAKSEAGIAKQKSESNLHRSRKDSPGVDLEPSKLDEEKPGETVEKSPESTRPESSVSKLENSSDDVDMSERLEQEIQSHLDAINVGARSAEERPVPVPKIVWEESTDQKSSESTPSNSPKAEEEKSPEILPIKEEKSPRKTEKEGENSHKLFSRVDLDTSEEEGRGNKERDDMVVESVDVDEMRSSKESSAEVEDVTEDAAEDAEEELEDAVEDEEDAGEADVAIGLCTGQFDLSNTSRLRTCSLPDLANLFKTCLTTIPELRERSRSLDQLNDSDDYFEEDVGDDSDDEETTEETGECGETGENAESEKLDENGNGEDGDDDDSDLADVAATMESLLLDDSQPSDTLSPLQLTGQSSPYLAANEEWQSDDDESGCGLDEDEEDKFHKLEEIRADLENQLGFDKFIEAYRAAQASHEDEDENLQSGYEIMVRIVGEKNRHLCDKILHLVMADGAYVEDND